MSDLAHRGAVPPDPTRQAAQRLLAQIADGAWLTVEEAADVRLVAEAVMTEAHPAKDAGMCASDAACDWFPEVDARGRDTCSDLIADLARRGAALQAEVVRLREALEGLASTSYTDPWRVGVESREDGRVAIKSGIYTVLTVGDYFDGGSDEQEAALEAICAVVNAGFVSSAPTQSVPPGAALKEDA